jgi:LmbE family N-acetylglucosaminyl deacetylase
VTLVVDAERVGTPAAVWRASPHIARLGAFELGAPTKVVLVVPHPDDEVFGAGGLIQHVIAQGIALHILAVTDGEASHPLSTEAARLDLRATRAGERAEALSRLGWSAPRITSMRIPDGRVAEHRERLHAALADLLTPGDLCLAPWSRDGHPDHDACGQAASTVGAGVGARTAHYLVWAWHWADPAGSDIPWESCRRLDLSPRAAARKRWATGAFRSQTRPLGPAREDAAVLPAPVLRRFWQRFEIYIESGGSPS